MCSLLKRSLFVFIFCISMIPTPVRAGSVGSEGALAALPSNPAGNDPIPRAVTMPLHQSLELKTSDVTQTGSAVIIQDNAGQPTKESPSSPKNERIPVFHEDEGYRPANIALVIAFGISLALNIYLLTFLLARRKAFRKSYR